MKFEYANVKYGSIIFKNKKSFSVFKVLSFFFDTMYTYIVYCKKFIFGGYFYLALLAVNIIVKYETAKYSLKFCYTISNR